MNENGAKKREWIKNAAIVFLTIMLILTFFSNTIMNYSLPEVAVQYVQSGTITSKIRGSGVVESDDPYEIIVNETRKVESVLAKVGDEVQKGDPLFILADVESDELKAAQEALDAAVLEFEKSILSGTISNSVVTNVQSGTSTSVAVYQSRILAAEAEIEDRQKKADEAELAVNQLTAFINQLQSDNADTTAEQRKVDAAQAAYDAKESERNAASSKLESLKKEAENYQEIIRKYQIGVVSGGDVIPDPSISKDEYDTALRMVNDILPLEMQQQNEVIAALIPQLEPLKQELDKAKTALADKEGHKSAISSKQVELQNWNLELADRQKKLKDAQDAKTQLLSDIANELSLGAQREQITKKREEVAKLQANALSATIEAPISGTISSIALTAGQSTTAGSAIATMQPEGKGFTMSFSVTNEQAKKLNPGIQASLVNSWMYNDVTVTLKSIRPDKTDPANKKLLLFDVTGSVNAGQTISVSVGDKSANYNLIVPNSAIREDNNGKFVLIVESKAGPLSTRYIATRVDVEVLATDDTQSAIQAALYGYEYVITTANKPVEAGKQVRMADN